MAYVTLRSGEQVGTAAGDTSSNSGGLKLEWQLRYYTSAETVTIMGKTYSCSAHTYKLYYKLHAWFGIVIGANIRIGNRTNSSSGAYIRIRNDTTNLWSATMQGYDYANRNPYFGPNSPKNTWYPVNDASSSDYKIYPEGLISLTAGATIKLNLDYYVGMHYNSSNRGNAHATSSSATFTVSGGAFALSLSQGAGSTITVTRNGSQLSDGNVIYYNDVLTISFGTNTGYALGTHTVNGSTFTSGNTHTVTSAVSIVSTAALISNTMTISAGTGTTVSVNRLTSPLGGAATGVISSGATVYYNDTLEVTFTANTGYTLSTHTIQGVTRDSGYVYTVKENPVSIIATAIVTQYTLSISAGTGSIITANRTGSPIGGGTTGNLSSGDTIYYSDILAITFGVLSGYTLLTHTVNGSNFNNGNYSVEGNTTITATAQSSDIPFAVQLVAQIKKADGYISYIPVIFNGSQWKEYKSYRHRETN